jgi:dienelactone hydrolase
MKPVSVILAGQTHQHEHYPSTNGGSAKHVLIFPTWAGITDFERDIAARLNSSGCDATLIDFFGADTALTTQQDRQKAIAPFLNDLSLLQAQVSALVTSLRHNLSEPGQSLSAIGFCLGGLCAIHAGLQEQHVDRVVSFHGLLRLPSTVGHNARNARFLILNGSLDPMVSNDEVSSAIRFFDRYSLDMTLISISGTCHSFMLPDADNPQAGVLYNPRSATRAWTYCEQFLFEGLHQHPH